MSDITYFNIYNFSVENNTYIFLYVRLEYNIFIMSPKKKYF